MTFIDPITQDIAAHNTPAFDWYKIAQPLNSADRSYKGGFITHALELSGGKYTPNDLHGYLDLSGSPASLQLDFAESIINSFQQPFTITDPNTVTVPANAKSLTMKIDAKTGIFTGSFKEGSSSSSSSKEASS